MREIDEAVGAGSIRVFPDDLARAVDAVRKRDVVDVRRIDDERIAVANLDEAEFLRAVDVVSGDLTQVIDALANGFASISSIGVVEGGVGAAAIEEAVRAAAGSIGVVADHLPRGIDAICHANVPANAPAVARGSSRVVKVKIGMALPS